MHLPLQWRSIRRRLPLLMSMLLTVVVLAMAWSAYHALERALFATASARLSSVAQRLAALFDESALRIRRDGARLARDSAYVRVLSHADEASRALALASFERERKRSAQVEYLEVVNRAGTPVVAVGTPPEGRSSLDGQSFGPADSASHGSVVGPLLAVGTTVYVQVRSPVSSTGADTIGYLLQYRKLSSGQGAKLIGELIGSDGVLLVGNVSGGLWTDLSERTEGPPSLPARGSALEYRAANGTRWVGAAAPAPHSPWVVWVQLPRQVVLAPAHRFLLNVGLLAALVIVVGTLGAWQLSRQITTPLGDITQAARDLAGGDYTRRVSLERDDELGLLASTFNTMAQQVHDSTSELELQAIELEGANEELGHSEARYRGLVDHLPDGIIVHCDAQVVFANDAAAKILRASSVELIVGRNVLDLVHADGRAAVRERITRNQDERVSTPLAERTLLRFDGTTVTVEAIGLPVTFDGRPAALTIVRDVSKRKELEQQLTQAQKMEAVGRLAGGVAHDFNNLLTVITSYSSLLLSGLEEGDQRREDVVEIGNAATRAAALTHQLLAFSRKQVLQPQPVSLNDVVGDLQKMLRRLIGEDIELVTSLDAELGLVNADPGQVEQVLMNLAVNARDAMPDGGRLVIETANVELGESIGDRHLGAGAGSYVMVAVTDTGSGMSREVVAHLFEPFFTTKEQGKGTGLGLSTVYGIVKQSGGDVWVYSEPGHGTTFKIYLPLLADETATESPTLPPPPVERGTETILLVEDDAALRSLAERLLRGAGYTVLVATDGQDALTIVEKHHGPIHLVATDVVMPGMSGRSLTEHLAAIRPEVRVLFMSGYTDDEVMRRGIVDKRTAFLQKPFTPDQLTRKVREVLHDVQPASVGKRRRSA